MKFKLTPLTFAFLLLISCQIDTGVNSNKQNEHKNKPTPIPSVTTSTAITPLTTTQGYTEYSCNAEGQIKSSSGKSINLSYKNLTGNTIQVYWLDSNGKRVLYNNALLSGQTHNQQTYVTHPWLFTDSQGKCLKIYIPGESSKDLIIGSDPTPTVISSSSADNSSNTTSSNDYDNKYTESIENLYKIKPDASKCYIGELNNSEKDKALNEVNFIRKLHNLNPVTYNQEDDIFTAKSALMTVANKELSHTPTSDWECYSPEGYKGSNTSNLYIGYEYLNKFASSEYYIDGFIIDDGVESLGHRRWILTPFLKYISFGRVDGESLVDSKYGRVTGVTLKVINDDEQNIQNTNTEYVAYPFLNYPNKLFKKDWYLSFSVVYNKTKSYSNTNVDFSHVSIEVIDENGKSINVNSIKSNNEGFGIGNILQWKCDGLEDNKKYDVKISNLKVNGESKNYNYWFNIN